jgi:hypothetical protein
MPVVPAGPAPDYTWRRSGRWYPTVTPLANGEMLVTSGEVGGGTNQTPLVYSRSGAFRQLLSNGVPAGAPWPKWYPFMFAAPNGDVFRAGGSDSPLASFATGYLNIYSSTWTPQPAGARATRYYPSAVMYEPGKILHLGGGAGTGDCENPANTTNSAEVIDLNGASQWQATGSMVHAREYQNATVLPDGKVLVTGGLNQQEGGVLPAESWDPGTGAWTTLAAMARPRGYHSTAVLLPDGRVLSGGTRPSVNATSCDQPNVEVFSPPYLFQGTRPIITTAPAQVYYNESFAVSTNDAGAINDVTWVRLSSVTHSFNENQRFNRLTFSNPPGTVLTVTPPSANQAPPGHYMLFILQNGVPSVAKIVRLVGPNPLGVIDIPSGTEPVAQTFQIGGWAIDLESTSGSGVDAVHVWAYRDFVTPVFVGVAEYGAQRPDVAAAYGSRFLESGYNLLGTLSPGTYLLAVFPHDAVNHEFTPALTRVITVQ